jgi:hypothetical protein
MTVPEAIATTAAAGTGFDPSTDIDAFLRHIAVVRRMKPASRCRSRP